MTPQQKEKQLNLLKKRCNAATNKANIIIFNYATANNLEPYELWSLIHKALPHISAAALASHQMTSYQTEITLFAERLPANTNNTQSETPQA